MGSPDARIHVVEAPPGFAVLGWAVLGIAALPTIMLPIADPALRTPAPLVVALGSLALLFWLIRASFLRARITVTVDADADEVRIAGPLYARRITLTEVAALHVRDDDGQNHGLVNWPVTGRAASDDGVRLNLGGRAALVIVTDAGERFTIVTEDAGHAERMRSDLEAARRP